MRCTRSESPILTSAIFETKYANSSLCQGQLQPNFLESSRISTCMVSSNLNDGSRRITICTGVTGKMNLETDTHVAWS
jgi:hypothetical protein